MFGPHDHNPLVSSHTMSPGANKTHHLSTNQAANEVIAGLMKACHDSYSSNLGRPMTETDITGAGWTVQCHIKVGFRKYSE